MIDITAAPFTLDADAAEWVHTTLAGMDLRAKVGQLFHLVCRANDDEGISSVLDVATPNGFMLRALPAADVVSVARLVQDAAPIPMLLSADVERGANGLYVEGTSFASAMQVAATGDVAFVKAVESRGMATAPKHFPGDGVDDRDQHLVTSVNRMSVAEWDESFGKVYKDVIDAGAR